MADLPPPTPVALTDVHLSPPSWQAGVALDCLYVFFDIEGDVEEMCVVYNGKTISTCCNGPIKIEPNVPPTSGIDTIEVQAKGPNNTSTVVVSFFYS